MAKAACEPDRDGAGNHSSEVRMFLPQDGMLDALSAQHLLWAEAYHRRREDLVHTPRYWQAIHSYVFRHLMVDAAEEHKGTHSW